MKMFKRCISVLLAALMAFAEPLTTLASTEPAEPTYVGGERLEDVPEGNYVYLGNTAITLREGNGSFSVPIYREGEDKSERAWVKIHTIDLTSVYGRDYRVEGKHREEHAGKKNIFQLLAEEDGSDSTEVKNYEFSLENKATASNSPKPESLGTDSDEDDAAAMDDDFAVSEDDDLAAGMDDEFSVDDGIDINDDNYEITDLKEVGSDEISNKELAEYAAQLKAANDSKDSEDSEDIEDSEDSEDFEAAEAELIDQKAVVDADTDSSEDDGISELAKLKYEQTGIPTREGTPTGTVNANITDQIFGAVAPEYMGLISYSCEQTIYFEPGEDEAEFTFRLYDNIKSDGSRMFSVIITETSDNIETYKVTNMSVLIEDDEETAHSRLSFASEEFDGTGNSTEVKIVRTDLLQTMATAVLTAENSDTEETEVLGELVFSPYEKEKTVKLNITHDSILKLTDLTAADEGDIMSAIVTGTDNMTGEYGIAVASETEETDADEAMLLSADGAAALADSSSSSSGSSEEKTFSIKVNGKELEGRYKNGDLKATLYDKSYTPELAVGDYFFAADDKNGGMFSYDPLHLEGDQPGRGGEAAEAFVFESDEAKNNKDFRKSHGWAHYFTREKASKEGRVRIDPVLDKASPMNALYYQYIAPEMEMGTTFALIWSDEWTSFRVGPKSFYTNGQPKDQVDKYVHHMIGKFDRGVQSALSVKITNENNLLYPMASAEDNCAFVCKTMFNIWGMAAMYKKYEVSVEDADAVSYKSADGKTTTVPYQVKIKCGADNPENKNVRDLYVNPVSENSNIVFTVQANNINGSTDTFGKLKGYKITIGNGNTKTDKTVNYPEDFIAFIKDSKRVSTDAIDYGSEAVEKEVAKINNDISIVPVDIYFVDWMNSVSQEFAMPSENMNKTAHYQLLKFKPVIDYIDVNVRITEPNISGKGLTSNVAHFKDSELKAGTTKTYHAGDMLDLSAVADNGAYRVTGYEVSVDGGVKFNHIEDSTQLVLQAGSVKGYIIRPEVSANDNYIEIQYASGANKYLHADNLVPQEALKDYPDLKGRNILDINPQAKDIYERIAPTVGKAYSVDIVVDKTTSEGKTVRATVKDGDNGKTYTTNKYYFLARNSKNNNKLKIGTTLSAAADVHDYTLTGSVVTKAISVRQDGKGYNTLPTKGYTLSAGSGQVEVTNKITNKKVPVVNVSSSTVADNGAFTIQGKSGVSGDLITVLCTNGLGDDQIIEVKLGINKDKSGRFTDNAGQLVMGYPLTAPAIKTVTYSYEKESSSQGVTLNESQIRLLDDKLTLTAVVDNKGRDIDSVKFIVRDSSGNTKELTAKPQDGKSNNVFEASVKNMLNYFHTGDKIYAYVVDKDSVSINYGTDTKKQQIVYPQIDTGLTTYVENEKITPKTFSLENDAEGAMKAMDVNLPVIGGPSSGTQSGLITFNKNWHDGHKSFSYTANIDAVYDNVVDSTKDKAKRVKNAGSSLQEAYKQRKEKLQHRADVEAENERHRQEREANPAEYKGPDILTDDMINQVANIFYQPNDADSISEQDLQDENVANAAAEQSPDAKAKEYLTQGYPRYSVNVYLCVDLEFVLNETTNEYVLSMWSVVVGGKYTIDQVYYNFIVFVPVYLDLTGMIQLNFYFGAVTDTFKNASKAGDFDNYTGNLKDMADGASVIGGTDAVFMGRFQVGAGVANVLGVRGGITFTFQFQFAQLGGASKDWAGAVIGVSGSIGIDLLVTQFNWTFGTAQKGWGTLKGKTKVAWLLPSDNDEKSSEEEQLDPKEDTDKKEDDKKADDGKESAQSLEAEAISLDEEAELMEAENGGYYSITPFLFGSDLDEEGDEGFLNQVESGGLLRSVPSMTSKNDMQTLKENAAEHTRPKLIALNEDKSKYMLLFIGLGKDTETKKDTAQLYYSINNRGGAAGAWSDPQPVDAEDCHYDSSPDVIEVRPNVFMAAWLDAREPIDTSSNAEDFRKAYTAFDVSGAIFDFSKGSTPEIKKFTFSSDEKAYGDSEKKHYFNLAPHLTKSGFEIYCTYLKRDISSAKNQKELTDLTKNYSAVAYVCYNTNALTGQEISEERIFSQHWDGKESDPIITNYAAEGFVGTSTDGLTDSHYVAVAYTIDGDNDFETSHDRNMYLTIFNTTDKIVYYPIKLTDDLKTQTMLQMNTLNGNVYLSWLEQGFQDADGNSERSDQRFSIMNISDVINALLQTGGISEKYFYPDGKKATPSNYTDNTATKTNASGGEEGNGLSLFGFKVQTSKIASKSDYNRELFSNVSGSTSLDNNEILKAIKSSINSLSTTYVGSGDKYNSSGWKDLGDGWRISGNDWYMLSADEMKEDIINYLVSKYGSDQIGWKDENKTEPAYYDRKFAESIYEELFKATVVGRAQNYKLPKYTTILADNEGRTSSSINEYKLVADGNDNIYVFFNDFCADVTHLGQELYAMRFNEQSASEFDKDKEEWNGEASGFSKPVMLTDENKIIDEFDVQEGADKGTLKIVSNLYDQTSRKNDLVYFNFTTKGSIKPVTSSIELDEHMVKGDKTEIQFDIRNEGLYTANGCTIKLELVDKDGKKLEEIAVPSDVKDYLDDLQLEPSASVSLTIPWTPDRDLTNTRLKVTATENPSSLIEHFIKTSYSSTVAVPYKPVIEINDYELSYEDGRIIATATVANHGNKDVNELKLVFSSIGTELSKDKELITKTVGGGLKSGEEKQVSFIYAPKASDFDGFERIKLELSAVCDGEELETEADTFTNSVPVVCEIDNGAENIYITSGGTKQLELSAAPYSDKATDATFSSSDPTVAYVDDDGVLHALKAGTVTITLYYPSLGISTSVRVTVGKSDSKSTTTKRGGRGSGITGSTSGQWSQDANGLWFFTAAGRAYKSEWAYIYNPYAANGQPKNDWFRFGEDGRMLTGWFLDADGRWYYLWPYSDNCLGHMVTGWQQIDGKWYYFNTVSDGTRGAMYINTTTPDGYRVGADGAWLQGA